MEMMMDPWLSTKKAVKNHVPSTSPIFKQLGKKRMGESLKNTCKYVGW